jgi:hypothetical protein
MKGIEYVVDAKGKRKAAVVDLKVHGEAWEDFYDALTAKLRVNEPRESFSLLKQKIRKENK